MDSDNPHLEIAKMMHNSLILFGIFAAVSCCVGVWFFWLAAKPDKLVRLIRKVRRNDQFGKEGIEGADVRSFRRKYVVLGLLLFFGAGFLIYCSFELRDSSRALFGGGTAKQYIEVHESLTDSISEMEGTADRLLEMFEKAKAVKGPDPEESEADRLKAIEEAQESVRELKATIERAKQ